MRGPFGNSVEHFRELPDFSKVATAFYIFTSNVRGFQFLHILVHAWYYMSFFYLSHTGGVVGNGFEL